MMTGELSTQVLVLEILSNDVQLLIAITLNTTNLKLILEFVRDFDLLDKGIVLGSILFFSLT